MSRYDGGIVDAHHHFWQPSLGRNPWLLPGVRIPFRYGDYEAMKRDYLPPDLLVDAGDLHLVGTVTMETEWDEDDPVGEMEWTAGIAERYGLPNAAVAHAVLDDPEVGQTLERLAAMPLVRAVRHKPGAASRPEEAASHPSKMSDPAWRAGYRRLAGHGLHFELQVAWWHLGEAVDLAREFPETLIVLNHAGLPSDRSPEGIAGWTDALRAFAALPNTAVKVSGIGVPGVPWRAEGNREIVERVAELFGPERMMFASNYPVDRLVSDSYRAVMGGFLDLTAGWSTAEQRGAFLANAVRYYRLDPSLLEV